MKPGDVITEKDVAEKFNVSRPTAKAAIERLVESGILSRTSNKPATIALKDEEDTNDLIVTLTILLVGATHSLLRRPKRCLASPIDIVEPDADDWETFVIRLARSLASKRLIRICDTLRSELRLAISTSVAAERSQTEDLWTRFEDAIGDSNETVALDCVAVAMDGLRRRLRVERSD